MRWSFESGNVVFFRRFLITAILHASTLLAQEFFYPFFSRCLTLYDFLRLHAKQVRSFSFLKRIKLPNGLRYPLVGGTRRRHFDGTSLKPRKQLENAQTP